MAILLRFCPAALAVTLLHASAPSAAFSPSHRRTSPEVQNRRLHFGLGYRKQTPLDVTSSIDLSAPANGVTAPDTPVSIATVEEEEDEKFDWFKTWLPLMPVEYLDREKPTPFKLLGMDIVVWNDGAVVDDESGAHIGFGPKTGRPKKARRAEGTWRAFADRCPHRAAPLSEGRVEDDGSLMCSYHAWRWEGDGDLVAIPQAHDTELDRIKKNPKSSCNSFPTKVKNGILWVWPKSGSDARILSELTPISEMSLEGLVDVDDESRVVYGPWFFRYLPYGWDFFVENVIDAAHVPVAHHGAVSSRYVEPRPLHINVTDSVSKNGFAFEFAMNMEDGSKPEHGDFKCLDQVTAPGNPRFFTKIGDDGSCHLAETYSSPGEPGFCNLVARQIVIKTKDGKVPITGRPTKDSQIKATMLSEKLLPKWIWHIMMNQFTNQDALFLHAQERMLRESGEYSTVDKGEGDAPDSYVDAIVPISSDKGVLLFRKWVQNMAGGKTPFQGNKKMSPIDKEVVFDVYNSHTKHCTACMGALSNLRKVRFATSTLAAAMIIWNPVFLGKLGTGALVVALAGAALVADKIIGLMIRMEFHHAEND